MSAGTGVAADAHPLDADGVVELAHLVRGDLVESRHLGAAVVVSAAGTVLRELGDGGALVYGRSSLKLFQAITVLRAGADLRGEEVVLATASHSGSEAHVEVVERILDRAGLTADDLQCPHAWPTDRAAMFAAHDADLGGRRVTMNCSGKHAAFLLACVHNGWDTADYLAPGHPLQERVVASIEEFTGESVGASATDGCGAPVFATTLRGLARGVGRVSGTTAVTGDPSARILAEAIRAHPWAIDGQGRANSVVIERLPVIAKLGAEGVMVMGTEDGTAVALKMLDGSLRAATLVALELLVSVGALDPVEVAAVIAETTESVTGGGRVVGEIRASDLVLTQP